MGGLGGASDRFAGLAHYSALRPKCSGPRAFGARNLARPSPGRLIGQKNTGGQAGQAASATLQIREN
jgi:hypothetical protein